MSSRLWVTQLDVPVHDPEAVDATIDEILLRDEFLPPEPSWLEQRFEDLGDWLEGILDPIFSRLPSFGGVGGGFGPVIEVVMWICIAAALGFALWKGVGLLRQWRRKPKDGDDVAEDADGPELTADELRREAERYTSLGDWRGALRSHYSRLTVRLADDEVVSPAPGRTTGEYRGEVAAAAPSVAQPFDAATDLFDGAWYADQPVTAADAERVGELADTVLRDAALRDAALRDATERADATAGVER